MHIQVDRGYMSKWMHVDLEASLMVLIGGVSKQFSLLKNTSQLEGLTT